jgi:S-DNA-T family DNA segregation ATPase FtsK/SpoIIIE
MRRVLLLSLAWLLLEGLLALVSDLCALAGARAGVVGCEVGELVVGVLPVVPLTMAVVRLVQVFREPRGWQGWWWTWRVRREWERVALQLRLMARDPRDGRLTYAGLRVLRRDSWGAVLEVRTVPGVGRAELAEAAEHLANEWGAARVSVDQAGPGRLRLRVVRMDPLLVPTQRSVSVLPAPRLWEWPVGRDELGQEVRLSLAEVPGIVVGGLPGTGKTSLLNGLVAHLAPSPAVQCAVLDGKGGIEWEDAAPRCWALAGDDLEAAAELLGRLDELRRARAASIRSALGVRDFWHVGPSEGWPLVLVVVDEAHTYLSERRGDRRLEELAAVCRRRVEALVKMGRSVGICVVLATQKPTADALPTSVRDCCPVALSFAQRSREAAVAVLGPDISEWPDVSPLELVGPRYVGVAVMAAADRPGYRRVRVPWVEPADLAAVCAATAGLRRDPTELLDQAGPVGAMAPGVAGLPPARAGGMSAEAEVRRWSARMEEVRIRVRG